MALAGTVLPAPALAQSQSNGNKTKTLRYPFEVAETGFDPAQLIDLYSRIVTAHIFENFYDYDHLARPFKIRPCTAEAMPQVSDDFRVWTVRIKPGIYFQDDPAFKGVKRELIAADYVYSWKRIFDPRWKSPTIAGLIELKILGMAELREAALKGKQSFNYDTPVEGMRALDRYTVQFKLAEPQPRFLESLTSGDDGGPLLMKSSKPTATQFPPIRSERVRFDLPSGDDPPASCWNAIRPIAKSGTTPSQTPMTPRVRRCFKSLRAAAYP